MYAYDNMNFCFHYHSGYKHKQISSDKSVKMNFSKLGDYLIDDSITFIVESFSDGVNISCKQLNLYSSGENYDEAKKDLIDELKHAWSKYVSGDKSNLSADAIEYGKILGQYVKKV